MKIVGYSDPISVAPGDTIDFKVSCQNGSYTAGIVKLRRGEPTSDDPQFRETAINSAIDGSYPGRIQEIYVGSCVSVPDSPPLNPECRMTVSAWVYPTTPLLGLQAIITKWDPAAGGGYGLYINEHGETTFIVGDAQGTICSISSDEVILSCEWSFLAGTIDIDAGTISVHQVPLPWWNSQDHSRTTTTGQLTRIGCGISPLVIAADAIDANTGHQRFRHHFNGKIDSPRLFERSLTRAEILAGSRSSDIPEGISCGWDFSADISSSRVTDISGNDCHGEARNLPTRAVTGHNWTGRETDFRRVPDEYGAIHFHDDDLGDVQWETDFSFEVPEHLRSGIYGAKLRTEGGEDYVPFTVRAPRDGPATAPILFLLPTLTYMAYGNEKFSELPRHATPNFEMPGGRAVNREFGQEEFDYIKKNRLASLYDLHPDGSVHSYFSRRRPILNMRPTYFNRSVDGPYLFPADLHLTDWLEEMDYEYDVATDEDLHKEGVNLLSKYKVVLTGTHPEYCSLEMLEGLQAYLGSGGRLMYLGGNGFYWATSFDPEEPHIIEMRRHQGVRFAEIGAGEYHHSTTGEPGGLWRHRGRAPQRLVGIGFCAQGIDSGSPYRRKKDSLAPEMDFIFEGIGEDEIIGNFESPVLAFGVAGMELDRYASDLGSPKNTIVLASSFGHSDFYQRSVEEVGITTDQLGGTTDPEVRADMVYFKTPGGGAVFSVGSITWCAGLAHNSYDNNVSRITGNVLKRFVSAKTFG